MHNRTNPTFFTLLWSFFKVGAFTFGGGYAMLPIIQKEIVDKQGWLETEEFVDVLAVAQSGPGAVAINTAIFTGYKLMGPIGVASATLGVVLPSFLIILTIAATLQAAGPSETLEKIFMGVRPAVVSLIIAAAVGVAKKVLKDSISYALAVIALLLNLLLGMHPAFIILMAATFGFLRYAAEQRKQVSK